MEETLAITATTPVVEIAARFPESARVFERHRVEYCLGEQLLSEACAERGLSVDALLAEIGESAPGEAEDPAAWLQSSLGEIMDHAVSRYHERLHEDLPHIARLAARAVASDAARHPEVVDVARVSAMLRSAIEEHTEKEERLLFPLIRQLAQDAGAARPPLAALAPVVEAMTREHDTVVAALAQLHKLTGGFEAPADASNAVRSLYHELAGLERGLQKHMLMEDQVLFPHALELEAALLAARAERGRRPGGRRTRG